MHDCLPFVLSPGVGWEGLSVLGHVFDGAAWVGFGGGGGGGERGGGGGREGGRGGRVPTQGDGHGLIKMRDSGRASLLLLFFFIVRGVEVVPFAVVDGAGRHGAVGGKEGGEGG